MKKYLIFILSLFIVGCISNHYPPEDVVCEQDAVAVNGRCIQTWTDHLYWDAAEERCQEYGGHLLSVHDPADASALDLINGPQWVGLRSPPGPLTWSWSDGTPVEFAEWWYLWAEGEPSEDASNHDRCGVARDDGLHAELCVGPVVAEVRGFTCVVPQLE